MLTKSKLTKNLLTAAVCSFMLFINTVDCFGQSITWQKTYGGPFDWKEGAHSLCEADSGNFYAVGYTFNKSRIKKILYVLKLNQYGDTIWSKVIGSDYTLLGNAACSDGNGGCVITGDGDTSFVINLDRNGNIKWWKNYGMSGVRAFDIIKTSDGGYVICGEMLSSNWSGYVLKIDSTGNELWQELYMSTFRKTYKSILQLPDSGFMLVGTILNSVLDTQYALITRLDEIGHVLWDKNQKVYESISTSGTKIERIGTNYLIAGTASGGSYFLITDTNGNKIFTKQFSTTKSEVIWDAAIINTKRYVFTMTRDSSFLILASKVLITDSLGNILHQKTFNPVGPAGYIWFESILAASNGDLLFGGFSEITDNDSTDIYIARTDSLLNVPPIGIINYISAVPEDFRLYPAYPNPFNPVTNIKFGLPVNGNIKISLFDILGRQITVLLNEHKQKGIYTMRLNTAKFNLASGIYFVVLENTNATKLTQKIMLMK